MNEENTIRNDIAALVSKFYHDSVKDRVFVAGKSRVNYAGRVYDEHELINGVNAVLDYWLTEGRFSEEFTEKLADYLSINNVILTNSGSSANLLALSALTSKRLGDRQLLPGDEVITVAAGFPATVTPIIQNGLIPVFVDVDPATANVDVASLEAALTPKTKCIILAHTLGNPFNIQAVTEISTKAGLWLIEDNCDALGSRYQGKLTGTFGDLATLSFYPAHHITTGEGGAIVTDNENLAIILRSFRDWGRDCYCSGGESNTCGKRFTQKYGELPLGYDHKYVYSEIGYNLKMTDIQAAIGAAQMDKLPDFVEARKLNFQKWDAIFSEYSAYFTRPQATPNSDPAWFAYLLSVKPESPFSREVFTSYLNLKLIETRNLFAGNLTKQPAFLEKNYRIVGSLQNTDLLMNNSFFLGTYPGLTDGMFEYCALQIAEFLREYR